MPPLPIIHVFMNPPSFSIPSSLLKQTCAQECILRCVSSPGDWAADEHPVGHAFTHATLPQKTVVAVMILLPVVNMTVFLVLG